MIQRIRNLLHGRHATLAPRVALAAMLVIVSFSVATAEPTANVDARASVSSVHVAEPFTLELSLTVPKGTKVTIPSLGSQLADFDLIETDDRFDIPDASDPSLRTWTRRLTLESIMTGEKTIPALEIQIRDPSSDSQAAQVVRSNPVTIQVVSVLEDRGDPTKFRDIQSVVDVDIPASRSNAWLGWSLAGVVGLTLLAGVGMTVLRRGKWVSPREWAKQELDNLEFAVDAKSVDSESSAQQLSEIVRDYLVLLFAIPEMGYSPQELLQLLEQQHDVDVKNLSQLTQLFSLADQVKFAGLQLMDSGMKSAISDSRQLVDRIADDYETMTQRIDTTENH